MKTLPTKMTIKTVEEIYGPGLFSGKSEIETSIGLAKILSTDWATVLEVPKQMAWLQFEDGTTKKFIEDDSINRMHEL